MILKGMIAAYGLLVIQFVGFVQCEKLHEQLTDEEFYKVFRTTRDNVPEYEVVPIHHDMYKRSQRSVNVEFTAFSRDLNINLDPSDGVLAGENTPVWLASAGSNGKVNYKRLSSNFMGTVAKTFRSRRSLAAFVVDDSTADKPQFEGTVEDLDVVPWPARLQEAAARELERSKREVGNQSRTLVPTDYHVVINAKSSSSGKTAAVGKQVEKILRNFNGIDGHRMKREVGEIIYPSLFINLDFTGSQKTDHEILFHNEIRYLVGFWNSVDLRFRDLVKPKIRLRIAGIIIGQGQAATPYLYNNRATQGRGIDGLRAFTDMRKYWNEQMSNPVFNLDGYDIIVSMTDTKLWDHGTDGELLGLAATASMCIAPKDNQYKTVVLLHDNKRFGGIVTATHELGHIFGAKHDIAENGDCARDLGYVMAPTSTRSTLMNQWSRCSVEKIQSVLDDFHNRHCADQPSDSYPAGTPINRTTPVEIRNAQQQCETQGFSWACDPTPRTCRYLQCWYGAFRGISTGWECQDAPLGALDGTPCGSGGVCVRGECRKPDTNPE